MPFAGLTCGTSPWYNAQSLKKSEISTERLEHLVKIREQSIKTLQQEIVVSTLRRFVIWEGSASQFDDKTILLSL